MKIQKNIGGVGRTARKIVGAALLLLVPLGFFGPEYRWAIFGLVGILPLLVGIVGYCPTSALFGMNTNKANRLSTVDSGQRAQRMSC